MILGILTASQKANCLQCRSGSCWWRLVIASLANQRKRQKMIINKDKNIAIIFPFCHHYHNDMFFPSFLIYRLEKYLVSNGFQVSTSTQYSVLDLFVSHLCFFFVYLFSIILSATDSRSVPSPNIVSLIFLYSIYVSFLSFFFYNFVSNGLQVSASTTQYCLLDRILPLLCLFLHRARNGLPLKLFCRSRNYHKNCFEEKCQAQTLELLRESGNMTAVTVFLCIFPMLSEDV